MEKISISIFVYVLVLGTSCDRPECKNTNSILSTNSDQSMEYRKELLKEISRIGIENLDYWFSDYSELEGKEYITVYVQGNGLCAKATILVNDWTNIEGIRRTKGKGYHGAKLIGLTFDAKTTEETIEFIYKGVDRILD